VIVHRVADVGEVVGDGLEAASVGGDLHVPRQVDLKVLLRQTYLDDRLAKKKLWR
jgi:hypothetical protein